MADVGAKPPESRIRGLVRRTYNYGDQLKEAEERKKEALGRTQGKRLSREEGQKQVKDIAAANADIKRLSALEKASLTGRNADGSYVRPEFESLIDPTTGRLFDEYSLAKEFETIDPDSAGYDAFKSEALRTGPSAYANMMMDKQGLEEATQMNKYAANQNALTKGAMDDLAAQGGLSSGSRERVARGGIRDALMGRQDIRTQGMTDRFNIQAQDEENRLQNLSQLPGMELNRANFQAGERDKGMTAEQFDVTSALTAMDRERADAMDAWKTNMQTWAANKQANAQAQASGGGK